MLLYQAKCEDVILNIQWFPGHMTKAIRMMEENLRLVDALIYVIDARAVASCNNPIFDKLLLGKKVLYVFNKCDLVKNEDLKLWRDKFESENKSYVLAVGTSGDCSDIVRGLKKELKAKIDKFADKGVNIPIRSMVVGVPNSGKSTIINSMCKKAKAVTGNRPGVTRGKQWLSVDGIDFLDTPGTLWAKFEDQKVAHHLAYIGSIREEVLDVNELAFDFLEEIKELYPQAFVERYNLECNVENVPTIEIFDEIAEKRGFKLKGGVVDYDRTAKAIFDDFRKGRLGKLMLEKPKTSGLIIKNSLKD